jgi:hemoglobin-like flavoprotein
LTREHIRLIRETAPAVLQLAGPMSQLFYGRLFELSPDLRPMFRGDIRAQGKKFTDMLGSLVEGIDHLDSAAQGLREMGQRHAGYGVKPEHYSVVGGAFLWTLSQTLESDFSPEVRQAWTALIEEIATAMQSQVRGTSAS